MTTYDDVLLLHIKDRMPRNAHNFHQVPVRVKNILQEAVDFVGAQLH